MLHKLDFNYFSFLLQTIGNKTPIRTGAIQQRKKIEKTKIKSFLAIFYCRSYIRNIYIYFSINGGAL